MSVATWGLLAKSLVDNEKIEEAIARLILEHNEDETSHLGSGQSLQSHKASEIIDHLASSIIEDKIKNGEITNPKIITTARAYTAIVDINGDGDYTDIQDAIDYVNGLDGGKILILPGTYNLTADLTLYDNVQLLGFDRETTIIDFGANSKSIKAEGDTSAYQTGTIAVTNNSKVIIGSATVWSSNVVAGEFIAINGIWCEIDSVDSDTQITLVSRYRGATVSGLNYGVAALKKNIKVGDLTVQNFSIGKGIYFRFVVNSKIENCRVTNGGKGTGIYLYDVSNSFALFNIVDWCDNGIRLKNMSFTNLVLGNNCNNNDLRAIWLDGGSGVNRPRYNSVLANNCNNGFYGVSVSYSDFNHIKSNDCNYSTSYGVYLYYADSNDVIGNACSHELSKGVYLVASCENTVVGNTITDVDIPIEISSSSSERNSITGNYCLRDNSVKGIVDNGTNTEISNNMGANVNEEKRFVVMRNSTGASLAVGDVVVLYPYKPGTVVISSVNTTITKGDDKIFGMVSEAMPSNAEKLVQTLGKTINLKVNGVNDIAVGDFLTSYTTAKIACKAGAGDMVFAVALEAYTSDDSNGVIDALLITPRKI